MKWSVTAALVVIAGQASALDCIFMDAAGAYHQAQNNGTDFIAVIGQLDWVPIGPVPDHNRLTMDFEGQEYSVDGTFTGDIIGERGLRTPIDGPVTIRSNCGNGDCGYAFRDAQMLSFIHNVDGQRIMFAFPCQSYPRNVRSGDVDAVQACIDGGPCDGTWDQ